MNFEESLKNLSAEEIFIKGVCYLYKFGVIEEDYEKAMLCFIKAMELGNIRTMAEIGTMYDYGYGVIENKVEAVKWYKRGAELGDTEAINSLAECFIHGNGVEKNIETGISWYIKSAKLGNRQALLMLHYYFEMLEIASNYEIAFELNEKISESKSSPFMSVKNLE